MISARTRSLRINLLASLLFTAITCVGLAARDQGSRVKPSAKCSELLAGISRNGGGSLDLELAPATWQRISTLRSQLEQRTSGGVVVYAFVAAEEGIAVIRFESPGQNGHVSEEVVTRSQTTEDSFRKMVNAARQKDNVFYRKMLKNDFNFVQPNRDQGKLVFLMDTEALGLVPQSFDLPESVVFASPDLNNAISNLSKLKESSRPAETYAALFALPHNEKEYVQVFGKSGGSPQYPPLGEWIPHWEYQQDLIRRHQLNSLVATGKTASERKADILRQLEAQDGLIMIIAHADGAEIRLSDTETIRLTPSDIEGIHFRKSAFVFLRVCQGKDQGFADAFLRAGAAGVWANRGPVDAEVANRQAEQFLQKIRAGKSVLSAIEEIMNTDPHAKNSAVLFTMKADPQYLGE